jgi:inorganic pyrophosphatase
MMTDERFWQYLDLLVAQCKVVIDRPAGSPHPRYADFIYPFDYGFLEGTQSMDQGGIDIWRGSLSGQKVTAVICTVDLTKRDSEMKILLGCTGEETRIILAVHNSGSQSGILVLRDSVHELVEE